MADESESKPKENALTEVARTIGSTLGTAANRASEMFRDVVPALSEKLGLASAPPTKSAAKSKSASKPKKQAARESSGSRKSSKKKAAGKTSTRKKGSHSKSP